MKLRIPRLRLSSRTVYDHPPCHGGRSSARLERQVVVLEVGGSSPLGHPKARRPTALVLEAAGQLQTCPVDPGRQGNMRL